MACLIAGNIGNFTHDMLVLGDYNAAIHMSQRIHCRLRHLPGCLASGNEQGSAFAGFIVLERAAHGLVRQHSSNTLFYNLIGIFSE